MGAPYDLLCEAADTVDAGRFTVFDVVAAFAMTAVWVVEDGPLAGIAVAAAAIVFGRAFSQRTASGGARLDDAFARLRRAFSFVRAALARGEGRSAAAVGSSRSQRTRSVWQFFPRRPKEPDPNLWSGPGGRMAA